MAEHGFSDPRPPVTLGGEDVRRLLRLWGSLHAPAAEPAERKRRLILGLCELQGANAGAAVVTLVDPETGLPQVVSAVRAAANETGLLHAPWHAASGSDGLLGAPRVGHSIVSSLSLQRRPKLVASLTLLRAGTAGSSNAQAVAVLELVHGEARSLYSADTPLASPEVRRLPHRQRHVLQYLLAGETESDAAKLLGVGVPTVRAEAKAAYSSLGVADREALLARWAVGG